MCESLLVVVRELEEKLLMAVKEKENLEDLLQDWQSEVSVRSAKYPVCPQLHCYQSENLLDQLIWSCQVVSMSVGKKLGPCAL